MKHKTMPASYAPTTEGGSGFEAIVSVFNNVDLGGDVVRPGAFKDSIAAWQQAGDPIPVYWSHRLDDPTFNVGEVKQIEELSPGDSRVPDWAHPWVKENGGLWVKAELDDDGIASQVRRLLLKRRVTQFSFTYDVIEERVNQRGENELVKLWLHEVGPTPLGMNPLTTLVGAKHAPPDDPPPDSQPDEPRERYRHPVALSLLDCLAAESAALAD